MKIKTKEAKYREVIERIPEKRKKPERVNLFFRTLLRIASIPDLIATSFECEKRGMERLGKNENAFFLMNHSSFIDLEIASTILYPRPFNIVCEADGFVSKAWLMRKIGCIPTHKFFSESALVRDLVHCARKIKTSILMYPEASYSFAGTTPTPLPDSLGKCIKLLKLPVVMINTYGAFHRDPLYNLLRKRKVKVKAKMEYLLSKDDIEKMTTDEINKKISSYFLFDHFKWQKDEGIKICESFRAEGLESVLYKCPNCHEEGKMKASGITLKCSSCNKEWEMEENGELKARDGKDFFTHIPYWFDWERKETEREIEEGKYALSFPVRIALQVDFSAIYFVGNGTLTHTLDGFHLLSDDGEIDFYYHPLSSYSLSSDIYWYELGDMISIGDEKRIFYLFPPKEYAVVTKARFATEKIYRDRKAQV